MMASGAIHAVFVHGFLSSAKAWRTLTDLVVNDPELDGAIRVHHFTYASPVVRFRLDQRIPDVDDVADQLRTYLQATLRDVPVVLVTHSMGGLIVQRFLARSIAAGEARRLARIKRIVMYACPNAGSDILRCIRRFWLWPHPQERQLQPLARAVTEAQQTVLRAIVNAHEITDKECPIPIEAYGASEDRLVPPSVATGVFPMNGVLDGDHFSVIRPVGSGSTSYQVLKAALLAVADRHGPAASMTPEMAPKPAAVDQVGDWQGQISVAPPFGRRDAALQGRDALIAAIMHDIRPKVHVLAGLGGSGKSRLALEVAYRAQQAGWRTWWIPLPQINSATREVANQLGASDSQVDQAWRGAGSATDLLWRLLNASTQPWLLVFDNADDPRLLGPLGGSVADGTGWLRQPTGSPGMVLVTSRDRDDATWGSWCSVHLVPPLGDGHGATMLMDLMDRAGTECGTYEQAKLLSAQLGGLPLALRRAADYLESVAKSRIWPGRAAINNFEDYRAAVKRRFEAPPGGVNHDLNEPLGLEIVQNVFELSLELLAQRGLAQSAPLLKVLACLNIAPIPYHLLLGSDELVESPLFTGFVSTRWHAALDALANLGLVEPYRLTNTGDPELTNLLSLHPLVHGVLRDDADVKRRRAEYYRLIVRMLLAAVDGVDPDLPESWARWAVLAPHTIEVSRTALAQASQMSDRQLTTSVLELARLTGRYLIMTGLLGPADDLVRAILDDQPSFGFRPGDREILALRHESARIALERGDPKAAERELRPVIAERSALLGENHADTLASRHKLAKAILDQGRWTEAEQLLASIVRAERKVRGPEHSDTMVVRHSLARAILAQQRPAEAEEMIRDILRVRSIHWSPTHPETLYARQTLARSLLQQEKAGEAEQETRDALRDAAERQDSPQAMSLRGVLAKVLLMQDRVPEAVDELTALLGDRKRVLGNAHPETVRTAQLLRRISEQTA